MVGLERFEMVVKLVEEVFVLCWHSWVVSLDDMHNSDIGDGHFPSL